MKPENLSSTVWPCARFRSSNSPRRLWAVSFFFFVALLSAMHGQTFSDNFDDGNDIGWSRYVPADTPPGNAPASFTFPSDMVGGLAYRLLEQAPTDDTLGPARVASFRDGAIYTDFFNAVDYVTWDDSLVSNFGGLLARVPNLGTPPLNGYLVAYFEPGPGSTLSILGNLKFIAEGVTFADFLETYYGGVAIVPRLSNARKYRLTFTGNASIMRAALYDRFDLLEPIAKIAFQDNGEGGAGPYPAGACGIVTVNASDDINTDWTFDNSYMAADPGNFIGFPGTPQVVELSPGPQTLFHTNSNPFTFKLRTFDTTQINTNSVRMFLNNVNVSSQLAIVNDGGFLDPPLTRFAVTYTGSLSNDTIYNGRIIVNDTGGRGTTNTWAFDTFASFDDTDHFGESGRLIIEAEDYNHSSGMFIDYPGVSGLKPDGTVVTPADGGYYNTPGTPGVDFFEPTRTTVSGIEGNQYRPNPIGTVQDRRLTGDTSRAKHIAAEVPDYTVWQMDAGEWLNYTRTFPSNTYNVYLRASSQVRQDVRFDEVTGDRTQPDQAKAIGGMFLVPNTGGSTRFRYVPLSDAVGNPHVVQLAEVRTLRLTALQAATPGNLSDLQLNYLMLVPASNVPSNLPPWIAFASPSRDASNVDPEPIITMIILNRDTQVTPGSVQLRFDGSNVTSIASISTNTAEGPGVMVIFAPSRALPPNSVHTINLVFGDSAVPSRLQTNEWSFTIKNLPLIPTGFAQLGGPDNAFAIQIHKATNTAVFANSSMRAEQQLANQLIDNNTSMPYVNEAANMPNNVGLYTHSGPLNFEQCGNSAGLFSGDTPFPGINPANYPCPDPGPDNIAMAATIKLQLVAGAYRMGVTSDDGFKVTAGPALPATNLVLGLYEGGRGPGETAFDFFVEADGVYPFRLLYYEGGGGATVEWYFINRRTGLRRLLNVPVPTIPSNFAAPSGTGSTRGFSIQIHKARNDAGFENSSARAEQQLANALIDPNTNMPYENEAANMPDNLGLYMELETINYEQGGALAGFFGSDEPFPGIPPDDFRWLTDPNNIAMAATAFLELPVGTHTFGVRSDDGFKVTTGPDLPATNLTVGLFEGARGSEETTFEFAIATAGLYPFRLLFYEGQGGADVEWYWFDSETGQRILINDAANSRAIKAYKLAGFRLLNPRFSGNTFSFDFQTVPGKTFHVHYKNSLNDATWTSLPPSVAGDGLIHTVNDSTGGSRFYRLSVE